MTDEHPESESAADEGSAPAGAPRDFAEGEEKDRPDAPRDFAEGEEKDRPDAPRDFAEGQEHSRDGEA